jgi:hypothetical protein
MSLTVCTGWSPQGYTEYGQRFAETFARFWPKEVELVVYGEELCPLPHGTFRLLSEIGGCMEFLNKYRNDPAANGRVPAGCWKPRERELGYSFRTDAWKFSRQGFIPYDAAERATTQFLCWLDADVVTHKPVPPGAIERLMPNGKSIAYLGREPKWPDIAFQLYRLRTADKRAEHFLSTFRYMYVSGAVFNHPQTHSAYIWQHCARYFRSEIGNLTPRGEGHVWFQSPLAQWTDHLKGQRKHTGVSRERHC